MTTAQSGCIWNVGHCQQQQSYSELSHLDDHTQPTYKNDILIMLQNNKAARTSKKCRREHETWLSVSPYVFSDLANS